MRQFGVSIAVDSQDKWHVVYDDYAGEGGDSYIKYINSTSGPLTISTGAILAKPSIAVDKNDKLHVVYFKAIGFGNSIMYMDNTSGSWSVPQEIASGVFSNGTILETVAK